MKAMFLRWLDESLTLQSINSNLTLLVKAIAGQHDTLVANNQIVDANAANMLTMVKAISNLTEATVKLQQETAKQSELIMTMYVMYDELIAALGGASMAVDSHAPAKAPAATQPQRKEQTADTISKIADIELNKKNNNRLN